MKSGLKVKRRKRGENQEEKNLNCTFTLEEALPSKNGLFLCTFFEFEEFSIEYFFSGSIQCQHTVATYNNTYREFLPYANFITANFITAVFQNYY